MMTSAFHFGKNAVCTLSFIVLICLVTAVSASDWPGFKSLNLPGLNYGSLKRDQEVTRIFETYKVLAEYNYYISGQGNIPYAIIGIHNKYKLRKGLWNKVDLTTQLLRSWIPQMDIIYGYRPYGSQILDHDGKPVGIWYSSKQWTTIIVEENMEVAVFTPEPPGFRSAK
jgi:hypothetical protein